MPAGSTYSTIATTTLGSATNTVTFNSIAGTYTDLILVVSSGSTSTGGQCRLTFNNDTGTNYSYTYLEGQDGTTPNAISSRGTSTASIPISGFNVGPGAIPNTFIAQIQNYSNSTTYKTLLSRSNIIRSDSYSAVTATVGLWRSTSAITRIDATHSSANFPVDSTFTLYGVTAA
jgi:hypothetical protein